jgi:hypothetical protein
MKRTFGEGGPARFFSVPGAPIPVLLLGAALNTRHPRVPPPDNSLNALDGPSQKHSASNSGFPSDHHAEGADLFDAENARRNLTSVRC